MRKLAVAIAKDEKIKPTIEKADLETYLGIPKFTKELYEGNEYAGVVTGLAWTALGGTILYIETSVINTDGKSRQCDERIGNFGITIFAF